ncbi:hypothetical protein ACE6H2_017007 [Prunus campanulata]
MAPKSLRVPNLAQLHGSPTLFPLCPTLTSLRDDFYQTVCSHNTFSQKSINETSRVAKGRVGTIIFNRPQSNTGSYSIKIRTRRRSDDEMDDGMVE